jgi:tetratricopeptide (TPR) repeat protein
MVAVARKGNPHKPGHRAGQSGSRAAQWSQAQLFKLPLGARLRHLVGAVGRAVAHWTSAIALLGLVFGSSGVAYAHAGLDEVERETEAALVRRPASGEAHLERARVHELRGEWEPALARLAEAETLGADRDVVGLARARILLAAGRPRRAEVAVAGVLARRPDAWAAVWERGLIRLALGDPTGAADDFGTAIAKLPAPRPEQVIARRDVLLSLGRREDALRALDEGMARLGPVPSLDLPAVDLEIALGRWEAALQRLGRLIARAPGNPVWIARRGDVLARAGRPAEARAEWTRALAVLDRRPSSRGGRPFADLRRRLEAALGPVVADPREERE